MVERLTLLVVDDDSLQARLLKAHLERTGRIHVVIAGSADDALQRLDSDHVDLVLTDMLMPDVDGVELARRIRSRDAALPIVVMSVSANGDRAAQATQAGATDFLPKPVTVDALLRVLDRVRSTDMRSAAG